MRVLMEQVTEKPGMPDQCADQLEQHYFCKSCHMLSFWLFMLQQFNKIYAYHLHFCYAYSVDAERLACY